MSFETMILGSQFIKITEFALEKKNMTQNLFNTLTLV